MVQQLSLVMQSKKLTLQRLMKEEASLDREPLDNALVTRRGILKFHFCLHNLEGPYKGGFYHGAFQLHENYPFAAPKLYFYTPTGRFDINMPICTSFTNYHQQSWTSAWNVRTLILATISFMYSQQPSYGCRKDTNEERLNMSKRSMKHNLKNPEFIELFQEKLQKLDNPPRLIANEQNSCKGSEKSALSEKNYTAYVLEKEQINNSEENDGIIDIPLQEEPKPNKVKRGKMGNRGGGWKVITKGVLCLVVVGVVLFVAYKVQ